MNKAYHSWFRASIAMAAVSACACAQPIKLGGSAARGGAKNKEGDSVYLTAAMGTTEEIRWEFAEPLAAGAWRLTVDFNDKVGGVKCQNIGFIADRTPIIDCNVNTDDPQSFVLLSAVPAKGVFYRKTYQVNQDTVGIRSIVIEKIETPLPSDRWCLDCQVVDGMVSLPWPIAPGSVKTAAKAPVALTWWSAGGKFETPSDTQTYTYCNSSVERLAVAGKVDAIIIERIPLTPVPDMPVTNKEWKLVLTRGVIPRTTLPGMTAATRSPQTCASSSKAHSGTR